jgi:hypothetical protein
VHFLVLTLAAEVVGGKKKLECVVLSFLRLVVDDSINDA